MRRFVFMTLIASLQMTALIAPSGAGAHCVECPIPMSSLSGVWVVQEYGYVVRIQSSKIDDGVIESKLEITDSATGMVIATGINRIRESQPEFEIRAQMLSGERVSVVVTLDENDRIGSVRLHSARADR